MEVIGGLNTDFSLPILITQHMPKTFTAMLAQHLERVSNRQSAEAVDGEPILPNRIYVAPGEQHMLVAGSKSAPVIRLDDGPPENFCKPAVDPMLRSVVNVYGARVLTVILTGMGHDGLVGAQSVIDAGGALLAQDEATSVVWGMPGAVANAGLCNAILPVTEIAAHIREIA